MAAPFDLPALRPRAVTATQLDRGIALRWSRHALVHQGCVVSDLATVVATDIRVMRRQELPA